jgi:hypothetical protein
LRLPLGHARALRDFPTLADLAANTPIYRVLRPSQFSVTLLEDLASRLFGLLGK